MPIINGSKIIFGAIFLNLIEMYTVNISKFEKEMGPISKDY